MKGFGFFTMLFAAFGLALILYAQSSLQDSNDNGVAAAQAARLERIATLRNVVEKSYAETTSDSLPAWRIAVQTRLGEDYGVSVLLDGQQASIIDPVAKAETTFYLVHRV